MGNDWLLILADALLIFHTMLVAFVILGLVAVYAGYFLKWQWVRNLWFRLSHLTVIAIVVLQSWFGVICPLTEWEMALRERAGDSGYEGSFIQYWLQSILYYSAPEWVFVLGYTVFGALVLVSWFVVRPRHTF
jgi:glucan phosphoethanolaminetransferase (alkaline phosphatase superfamily)